MAKIFFPYERTIRFPFIVDNLLSYCDLFLDGDTLYIKNSSIAVEALVVKTHLVSINDILYILNGSVDEKTTPLCKESYVEFKQYGAGLHTIGLLDLRTLGEIDPLVLPYISNISADWVKIENAVISAISRLIVDFEHIGAQINSTSIAQTSKTTSIQDIHSEIYSIGIGCQRVISLGELDSHILDEIDSIFITMRIFENLSASKSIYFDALYSGSTSDCAISLTCNPISITLMTDES